MLVKLIYDLGSILPTIYARVFHQNPFAKKSQNQSVIREKLQNLLSYKKLLHKMLVKLIHDLHNFFECRLDVARALFSLSHERGRACLRWTSAVCNTNRKNISKGIERPGHSTTTATTTVSRVATTTSFA